MSRITITRYINRSTSRQKLQSIITTLLPRYYARERNHYKRNSQFAIFENINCSQEVTCGAQRQTPNLSQTCLIAASSLA